MTYKIRPKRSNVSGKIPQASDLELGELAINMADQKIYTKTPTNTIVELGGGSGETIDLLAVASDIIPDGDLTRSLGSPDHQWADLYVGNATIYLNNIPLGLDGDQNLTFNGNVIANSDGFAGVVYADIVAPATPVPGQLWYDSSDGRTYIYLDGSWVDASPAGGSGGNIGNITFTGSTISSSENFVDINATSYTQLESNGNYLWLNNSGVHVEITDGEGGHEFTFAWNNGQAQLQLPSGADIVDSAGNSVLGGGGNPFDQDLNTTDDVTFNSLALGTNITSNGLEIYTNPGSGGSIDLYTDWTGTGTTGGLDLWLVHGDGIYLKTGDGLWEWKFDDTGKLHLPAGGDIVDSTGTSVLGGGGTPGANGASAYEIAVANGFVGNEVAWLASLQGAPGADGAPGQGVPAGGTAGQVLAKIDSNDYNTEWVTPASGNANTGDITFNGVQIIGAETNRGGGSIELVPNNSAEYVTAGQYLNIYPTFAQDAPHIHVAAGTGGDLILGDDNYNVDVNHNGYVRIRSYDSGTSSTYQWRFHNDGNLQLPSGGAIEHSGSYTKTSTSSIQDVNNNGIVWTGTQDLVSSVKLTIQTQSPEVGDSSGSHYQTCEAIIASRGVAASGYGVGEPVMTVYGVTHTSTAPLATFTVQRNATTKLIEIVATRTAATNSGIDFRIHSVEMIAID